tara:strand:- start:565 stop:849 length:285 start_codon:yes stop_codon:yes gene_type:complete
MTQKTLQDFRKEIDALDKELVDLIAKRFEIIDQVAHYKDEHNIPAVIPERVDQVRDNAANYAQSLGLNGEMIAKIWQMMIDEACRVEQDHFDKK